MFKNNTQKLLCIPLSFDSTFSNEDIKFSFSFVFFFVHKSILLQFGKIRFAAFMNFSKYPT